jgi:hypothetical protein
MMHHFKGPNGTVFSYSSDFGGDVHIARDGWEAFVDGKDILALVAEHLRSRRIGAVEVMSVHELLGLRD